jgi:hypothetical protein
MIFEIKLVALNGKFIHQIEAEGMKQEEEETNHADLVLAHHIGEADSPYCDACNTCVALFDNCNGSDGYPQFFFKM